MLLLNPRSGGRLGRDSKVVGFTTSCAISVYYHKRCEFESRSWRGVLETKLCDKVCQCLLQVGGYSSFPTNKTDPHHITEILLKEALNTIALILNQIFYRQILPL